ncbi:MAG: radical SAM protein [Candidatus Helarchaeota archaeon]
MLKDLAKLKIALFCHGLKFDDKRFGGKGRRSGAGPAGGRFLRLAKDIIANVPTWPKFVKESIFELRYEDNEFEIWREGKELVKVELIPSRYDYYDKKTSNNIIMRKIALIHGEDCLATTVNQRCYYWRTGQQCVFCGIEESLKRAETVAKKDPIDLYETAQSAIEEGVCKHITLTTGTVNSEDKGAKYMEKIVRKLSTLGVPIHVQVEPPRDFKWFDKLHDAGAETIGVHIETMNPESFSKYCPGKSNSSSIETFINAWRYCLDIFGKNQVDTYYLIGLEKSIEDLIANLEKIANLEVIPFPVQVRPISGAKLEDIKIPEYDDLLNIYSELGKILHKNSLNPFQNKAGCVRCNSCSALKEAYRYLS